MPYCTAAVFQKSCEVQEFLRLLPDQAALHKIEPALIFHDFLHGHILAHGIFLGDDAQSSFLRMRAAVQRPAVQKDPSFCRQQHCRQHTDRRCLSRSIGAQKAEKLPVADRQVNMVHCRESSEFLCESLYLDHLVSFTITREKYPASSGISSALRYTFSFSIPQFSTQQVFRPLAMRMSFVSFMWLADFIST